MFELPAYSPYGVPPPPAGSSSSNSLAQSTSTSTAPPEPSPPSYLPQPLIRQPRRNLAGPVQTVSLSDKQHDYFQVTRTSPTSLTSPTTYNIALTTDPTPLYRIEVDPRPTADPAIQLFDFVDPFPLAAARMHPHVTAAAAICTREPATDGAKWHSFHETYALLVMEVVPGLPTIERSVSWKYVNKSTHLACSLLGSLFGYREGVMLAKYGMSGPGLFRADMVFEIIRGGGIEFELGIVVQAFARIELDRRRNAKRGRK